MTRQTTNLLEGNNITRELVVRLDRSVVADAMSHLIHHPRPNVQPNRPNAVSTRRGSVATTNLFLVNNVVREAGFDRFEKIPRSTVVNLEAREHQSIRAAEDDDDHDDEELILEEFRQQIEHLEIVDGANQNDATGATVQNSEAGETATVNFNNNNNQNEAGDNGDNNEIEYLDLNDLMIEPASDEDADADNIIMFGLFGDEFGEEIEYLFAEADAPATGNSNHNNNQNEAGDMFETVEPVGTKDAAAESQADNLMFVDEFGEEIEYLFADEVAVREFFAATAATNVTNNSNDDTEVTPSTEDTNIGSAVATIESNEPIQANATNAMADESDGAQENTNNNQNDATVATVQNLQADAPATVNFINNNNAEVNANNAFGWFDPDDELIQPIQPVVVQQPRPSRLRNDFEPFRRIENVPFGRRRRSLSANFNYFKPQLDPILEDLFGYDVESLFH